MLVCCCRVLLVLCALFWRGGRVFPFSFPFVLLCLPLSFLSSLVGACACASLLCLYSQGYFCSPLTPAKKPLWTGRFCVPRPPGCWSSSAACLRLPPPLLATAPAAWTCRLALVGGCWSGLLNAPASMAPASPLPPDPHLPLCGVFFSRIHPFTDVHVACHVFHPPCSFLRVLFAVAFLLRSWEHRWVRSMYVWWGRFLTRPG